MLIKLLKKCISSSGSTRHLSIYTSLLQRVDETCTSCRTVPSAILQNILRVLKIFVNITQRYCAITTLARKNIRVMQCK